MGPNVKGLNIFKNKECLTYHYHQKVVDAGASTAAGSSNGVVYVSKTNFNSVFLLEMI